jgi:hypothetical protein
MNISILKNFGKTLFDHFRKNGSTYAKVVGGAVFSSAITVAACHMAFKKIETKHRKEDAEKLKKEFSKKLHDLEKRYQHNEFLLKQKINELCDEFVIDHVF